MPDSIQSGSKKPAAAKLEEETGGPTALEEEINGPTALLQIAVMVVRVDENGGPAALVQIPTTTAQESAAVAQSHLIGDDTTA
jgi:hypothetical protein